MSFRRSCVRTINSFVSLVVVIMLILFGTYSVYSLWDNRQVYSAAYNVQIEMQKLKPQVDPVKGGPSFEELAHINPDVCAWLTMDGTAIDYPILQGSTNLTYINKDVYGNFALAGSLFLDCQNSPDFSDPYSLVFGHHMANSLMFGDLDLYKDKAFFRKNTTGTLMTRDTVYDLKVLALLVVSASNDHIFDVSNNQNSDETLGYIKENATYLSTDFPEQGENIQLLALTTCASEFTDARTIVITSMTSRN